MEHDTQAQEKSILQGNGRDFPRNTTIAQYFRDGFKNGKVQHDHVALTDGGKVHTFHQLDDISTKIGNAILECIRNAKNLNPDGDRVIGVCIQPSDQLITILFGILKAGAAYVPFDITFPEERIAKIVKDCRPLLVICNGKSNVLRKYESVRGYTNVISTEELYKLITSQRTTELLEPFTDHDKDAEATAIVLYTSGSSGEPKGVRLSHQAVMNRLNWQWEQFPFIPTEKCVFKTALTFVDSVAEIFGPLLQGFQLVVFDKSVTSQPPLFMEKLHAYEISRVVVVPSLLKAIFQTVHIVGKQEGRRLLSSVRLWICSGEALSYDLLSDFFDILPEKFALCNFYGSTEVMGDVTFIQYSSIKDVERNTCHNRVPIGFPVHNTFIYILNENLDLVEDGKLGEIFVGGNNLAKGYVGLTESDKFLPNAYSKSADHSKMYRTGDFGRISRLPTGISTLMYEGRIDSQIKVRGQRVDLSEVEAAISVFDTVSKVKVLCYHPGMIDQTTVAYIVPETPLITEDQIKTQMDKSLRDYEKPVIRFIKEIPLLVNGKTDRQRLLKMFDAEMQNCDEFEDWTSLKIPNEKLIITKTLFKIITQVAGTPPQVIADNINDSFFNIGGTSLNAVAVIVKLREHGYYISIPEFTLATTIRDIVSRIRNVENEGSEIPRSHLGSEKYNVSKLTDADKEEAVHIISNSFSKKGDLEAYVNVTYGEFSDLIKSIWKEIVEKQFSFIVRRPSSGEAVAVSLSFDVYDEPNESVSSKGIEYVMGFLEHVESKQREKLPKGKGKLLHSFMMGTSEHVDDAETISLIEFMEEQNILLARQHAFAGILTTNTNPLTVQIGQDVQGYEVLCEYQVNEYTAPDGIKPFGLAPNSFKIVCCWKQLLS